jgi:hypothetical protein
MLHSFSQVNGRKYKLLMVIHRTEVHLYNIGFSVWSQKMGELQIFCEI